MDRKATQKNFYREIRKSPGRFLSIFFIVAMGVAFFSGIRASEPSMRITGDAYFDGADLMDLEVISTLGITEDDIEAFEEIEGVELAEGSYSSDFLCDTEDRQYVFHVMSLTDKVNQPDVLEGRMPEKVGECLMDADMGYKVGDTVTLKSGTGDPLEDTLKTDTYEIVGLASSPCYVSFERGSATIGSGSISGFMLVPSKTFAMETYSEAYIKVAGAADEIAYTDAYEDKVQKVSDRIEEITGERGRIRKQEILADAQEEIDEGRKRRIRSFLTRPPRLLMEKSSLPTPKYSWRMEESSWRTGKRSLPQARKRLTTQGASTKAACRSGRRGRRSMKAAWRNMRQGNPGPRPRSSREKRSLQPPGSSWMRAGPGISRWLTDSPGMMRGSRNWKKIYRRSRICWRPWVRTQAERSARIWVKRLVRIRAERLAERPVRIRMEKGR